MPDNQVSSPNSPSKENASVQVNNEMLKENVKGISKDVVVAKKSPTEANANDVKGDKMSILMQQRR